MEKSFFIDDIQIEDYCTNHFIENDSIYFEDFIEQHELINNISPSGVNTLRIISIINGIGKPEIIGSVFRISVDCPIDNYSVGNLAAEIDLNTGTVITGGIRKRAAGNIKFLFVGRGKEKQKLVERANKQQLDNCIFLNKVSKYELNTIMSRADIGLMVLKNVSAFYYGTSPNNFFDYLSASLPIINNYPGWLADMIEDNKCGIVVEPEDPKKFADALVHLGNNPELRREMGINARKLGERQFSRDDLANEFVTFIEDIYKK